MTIRTCLETRERQQRVTSLKKNDRKYNKCIYYFKNCVATGIKNKVQIMIICHSLTIYKLNGIYETTESSFTIIS